MAERSDSTPEPSAAISKERPHVLRQYSLIADGHRGALVGPSGDLAWMCFPTWHDAAVFAGLLGSSGGFAISPVEPFVWGGYHEEGSLIWRSRWITADSIIECRDALAMPSSRARAVVLRRIEVMEGEATVQVSLQPACDYGRQTAGRWAGDGDVLTWHAADGATVWRISGVAGARSGPHGLVARVQVAKGGAPRPGARDRDRRPRRSGAGLRHMLAGNSAALVGGGASVRGRGGPP